MTKNKLTDLNDHLFAQLERLGEEGLAPDKLKQELGRAKAIAEISEQVVANANLQLKAAAFVARHGQNVGGSGMLPMIEVTPKPDPMKGVTFKNKDES